MTGWQSSPTANSILVAPPSSTLLWSLGDHLGSTSKVVNFDGQTEHSQQLYKPWGEKRYPSGASTLPTTYRYTGQRSETGLGPAGGEGLMYYGARWYDASAGRFISADTVVPGAGNSQAYDRYAYTLNNSVRYTDPSGHRTCNAKHVAEGDCSDYTTTQIIQEFYGVTLVAGNLGEFSSEEISAIYWALPSVCAWLSVRANPVL